MNHIKNNSSVFSKLKDELDPKDKQKKRKRPSSSDMRKQKKMPMNKLIDSEQITGDLITSNGSFWFDNILSLSKSQNKTSKNEKVTQAKGRQLKPKSG